MNNTLMSPVLYKISNHGLCSFHNGNKDEGKKSISIRFMIFINLLLKKTAVVVCLLNKADRCKSEGRII